jgi:riboflavin kinase/FMN adenylyltransferase
MSITGTVLEGDQRGRELGFSTANIRLSAEGQMPEFGVYAGLAAGRPAAISVGVRPTFGEGLEPRMEVHILDFQGDLYGRELSVELLEYLRPERRFGSPAELVAQLQADVAAVRAVVDDRGA